MEDISNDALRQLKRKAGKSNELLSDQGRRVVHALLSDTEEKLNVLNRRFAGSLSSQQARLLKRAQRYRIALAPQKTLPPEMLNYIFLLASDRSINIPILRRHFNVAPWNISYVCSRWRQVALSEPRLWANIAMDYSYRKNYSKINTVGEYIISRTRDCGISLLCTENTEDPAPGALAMQRQLIMTYAPRLAHFTMETTRAALITFLEMPPLQFTSLESITLANRGIYPFNDIFTDRIMSVFSNTPSLRRIKFFTFQQYRLPPYLLLIPWVQITDLALRHVVISHDMTLFLLQQCTNLTNCTLTLGDNSDTVVDNPPNDIDPITIHQLHSLTLQINITALGVLLLNSVVLPSLQTLDVGPNSKGGLIGQALPQDAILSMLKRSRCKLDSFTCKYRDEFDFTRVLGGIPDLRSFSLTARYLATSIIEAISRGELLPKLEHIQCGLQAIHPFLDFMENSWSKMDRSSTNSYKGLMSVNVWGYGLADQAGARARIDSLQRQIELEGRNVSIMLGDECGLS